MSLAKVVSVSKSRKDQGACGKCGVDLPAGSPYVHFSVGFRGYTQKRCAKPECYPRPSERESSLVADIYGAQEDADAQISSADEYETLTTIRDDVVSACEEVVQQYSDNPTFEGNGDLQDRVDTIESAASELENWEPNDEEPTEEDEDSWTDIADTFDEAHDSWLEDARESLRSAIDGMELP